MANNERLQDNGERYEAPADLEAIRSQQQEKIRESHERADKSPEKTVETARQEALEKASSIEKQPTRTSEKAPRERRKDGPVPRRARDASFNQTMKHIQEEMNAPSRTFSKVIHNKTVDRVSNAVGATVARPNAILSGSFFAFIFTLGIFLVARHYGYPLSGSEAIASFIIGWMAGLLFDYLRLEIRGGR